MCSTELDFSGEFTKIGVGDAFGTGDVYSIANCNSGVDCIMTIGDFTKPANGSTVSDGPSYSSLMHVNGTADISLMNVIASMEVMIKLILASTYTPTSLNNVCFYMYDVDGKYTAQYNPADIGGQVNINKTFNLIQTPMGDGWTVPKPANGDTVNQPKCKVQFEYTTFKSFHFKWGGLSQPYDYNKGSGNMVMSGKCAISPLSNMEDETDEPMDPDYEYLVMVLSNYTTSPGADFTVQCKDPEKEISHIRNFLASKPTGNLTCVFAKVRKVTDKTTKVPEQEKQILLEYLQKMPCFSPRQKDHMNKMLYDCKSHTSDGLMASSYPGWPSCGGYVKSYYHYKYGGYQWARQASQVEPAMSEGSKQDWNQPEDFSGHMPALGLALTNPSITCTSQD